MNPWERCTEVVAGRVPGTTVALRSMMEPATANTVDLVARDSPSVGIRIRARGLSTAYDQAVSEPTEHYLVQLWPSWVELETPPPALSRAVASEAPILVRPGGIHVVDSDRNVPARTSANGGDGVETAISIGASPADPGIAAAGLSDAELQAAREANLRAVGRPSSPD